MSRIKDLKNLNENNLNLFDLFSLFSPDRKSKYTETLLRLMKGSLNNNLDFESIKICLEDDFGIRPSDICEINKIHLFIFFRIIETMFDRSDLKSFQKFCELNERGLIRQNDLYKYTSFQDIIDSLSIAELSLDTKNLEKQIKILYQDDEWFVIRPLTFFSSKKYGSNTKWCTTQENNPEYFFRYASKGVLIYCINKKNGYKVASFYSLDKDEPEFSWWNQQDKRIDSLQSEITDELIKIIFKESSSKESRTNRFYLSDEERNAEENLLKCAHVFPMVDDFPTEMEPVMDTGRNTYLRRALNRAIDEVDF